MYSFIFYKLFGFVFNINLITSELEITVNVPIRCCMVTTFISSSSFLFTHKHTYDLEGRVFLCARQDYMTSLCGFTTVQPLWLLAFHALTLKLVSI